VSFETSSCELARYGTGRIVCHFSCGAASAVATKLILSRFDPARVVIFNAFIVEEHTDNRRFLADCEWWFNHPITVLRDEKYGASVDEVFRRKRFMKSALGAPCSALLKRELIDAACLPDDFHVFGFTVEETDRAARFPQFATFPLIDANLTHADCLAMIQRAGLVLPEMYRLGFNNANCVGCVKGGEGYFNKVREVFPLRFAQLTQIQEGIGPGAYLFRNRETGVRFGLKDLQPGAGRHDEQLPDCSFFCAMAEQDIEVQNVMRRTGPTTQPGAVPQR
jgi:hypothetical protein